VDKPAIRVNPKAINTLPISISILSPPKLDLSL
jgi:hypothetical protein